MHEFKNGDSIKKSTLIVLNYETDSKVRCMCSECLLGEKDEYVSMVYNESELLHGGVECRFCKEVKKAKDKGLYNERSTYLDLLTKSNEVTALLAQVGMRILVTDADDLPREDTALKYPLGELYGELKAVAYLTTVAKKSEYGVKVAHPSHIVLCCENCDYTEFVRFEDLVGKHCKTHVCPVCSKLKSNMIKKIEKRKQVLDIKEKEKSKNRDFQYTTTEFSKLKSSKSMRKNVEVLESKNPDYKVVDITKEGNAITYHLACKECGTVYTCMRRNAKLGNCSFCEKAKQAKDFNRAGLLNKNYIGAVFNGVIIVSQEGFDCTIQCTKCGKQRSNIDLLSVLSKRIYCDCTYSGVEMFCPECYAPIENLSYKDIYRNKIPTCPSCGFSLTQEDYLLTLEGIDYSNSLRAKLNFANARVSDSVKGKKILFGNKFSSDILIVEKEPVYKGNDEKSYYRCLCKSHNIGLTLSEDEIQSYSHEYCDDTRQSIVASPDASSIKLS